MYRIVSNSAASSEGRFGLGARSIAWLNVCRLMGGIVGGRGDFGSKSRTSILREIVVIMNRFLINPDVPVD